MLCAPAVVTVVVAVASLQISSARAVAEGHSG
jgi:hypothetical protein